MVKELDEMTPGRVRKRLAEIRKRESVASPGPWNAHGRACIDRFYKPGDDPDEWRGYAWVGYGEGDGFDSKLADLDRHEDGCDEFRNKAEPDAEFIAAARSDVPFLLAYIKHLTKRCEAAEYRIRSLTH